MRAVAVQVLQMIESGVLDPKNTEETVPDDCLHPSQNKWRLLPRDVNLQIIKSCSDNLHQQCMKVKGRLTDKVSVLLHVMQDSAIYSKHIPTLCKMAKDRCNVIHDDDADGKFPSVHDLTFFSLKKADDGKSVTLKVTCAKIGEPRHIKKTVIDNDTDWSIKNGSSWQCASVESRDVDSRCLRFFSKHNINVIEPEFLQQVPHKYVAGDNAKSEPAEEEEDGQVAAPPAGTGSVVG